MHSSYRFTNFHYGNKTFWFKSSIYILLGRQSALYTIYFTLDKDYNVEILYVKC